MKTIILVASIIASNFYLIASNFYLIASDFCFSASSLCSRVAPLAKLHCWQDMTDNPPCMTCACALSAERSMVQSLQSRAIPRAFVVPVLGPDSGPQTRRQRNVTQCLGPGDGPKNGPTTIATVGHVPLGSGDHLSRTAAKSNILCHACWPLTNIMFPSCLRGLLALRFRPG